MYYNTWDRDSGTPRETDPTAPGSKTQRSRVAQMKPKL